MKEIIEAKQLINQKIGTDILFINWFTKVKRICRNCRSPALFRIVQIGVDLRMKKIIVCHHCSWTYDLQDYHTSFMIVDKIITI